MINFLKCFLICVVLESSAKKNSYFSSNNAKDNISVERDILKYPKKFESFRELPYVYSNSLISRSDFRLIIVSGAFFIYLFVYISLLIDHLHFLRMF